MGDSSFVDLLPFDGDARGTTGLSGLVLNSVDVVSDTSGATVQYTTDDPAAVQSALVGDVTGGTGISWTTGIPAADSTEVTALRFVPSVPFTTGAIGKAEITLTPTALEYGGTLVNSVDGSVDGWSVDLRNAATVTLDSSASQVTGNVFNDPDFAFARTENSTGVASPVVRIVSGYAFGPDGDDNGGEGDDVPLAEPITALVGADAAAYLDDPQVGDFVFPGLAPGRYDVQVTPAAGTHVGVLPDLASNDPLTGLNVGSVAHDVVIAPSTLVTGLDFGIQRNVSVPQAQPDEARVGVEAAEVVIPVLTDSTAVDTEAQVALNTRADTLEGDTATVSVADGQTTSQVSVDADGQIVYTPNQDLIDGCTAAGGEACTEQLEYTLTDWLGQSGTGLLTVTVQAAPAVTGGTAAVALGSDATFDAAPVTVGSIASATVVQAPEAGTVTTKADGTVTYRAGDAEAGAYTFTVRFTDDLGQSSTATYSVSVVDGPGVIGGTAVVPLGGSHTFDAAPDSATGIVSAEVVQTPTAGTVTADVSGEVTYDAGTAVAGVYRFQVAFTDDLDQTAIAAYTVTVQGDPTLTGGSAVVPMAGSHTFDAAPVTTGEIVSAVVTQAPAAGAVTVTAAGSVVFDAGDAAAGVYAFDVTLTDDFGQTGSAHFQVTVQAAPVVSGDTGRTGQRGTLTFDAAPVTTGSIATAVVGAQPAAGGVTVTADGAVIYRAEGADGGEYPFTVDYTDDLGQTGTAAFTVTVQAVPTATGGSAVVAVGGTHEFDAAPVTGGRIAAATVSQAPGQGGATVDTSGAVTFTAGDAAAGEHAFVVTFTDDLGQTGTARFVVTVQGAPVVTGGSVAIPLGGTHTFDAAPVTTGEIASAVVSQGPAAGAVTVDPSGAVAFDAGDAALGSYGFAVVFTDDLGQSATAEFTVVVQDGPTAVGGTGRIGRHGEITFDAEPRSTGTIVRAELGTAPTAGTATASTDGAVVYAADGAAAGTYTFTVTFVDDSGQIAEVGFTVEVQAAPTALDVTVTTKVSTAATIDLSAAFDGGSVTLDRVSAPGHGTARLQSDGTVLYTPVAGYVGADSFTYTVADDLGQSSSGTVRLTVLATDTGNEDDTVPPVVVTPPGVAATRSPGLIAGPSWLPRTGAEVTGASLIALLMAGAGVGLVHARRRRTHGAD
nr:Ig-like domain-containing protein [Cellulomonas sp. RIT-PI-Y]